jgi:hypothetical protein
MLTEELLVEASREVPDAAWVLAFRAKGRKTAESLTDSDGGRKLTFIVATGFVISMFCVTDGDKCPG